MNPPFFAALFDFSFKNYITIKFASILYIAGIVLLTLGWFGLRKRAQEVKREQQAHEEQNPH